MLGPDFLIQVDDSDDWTSITPKVGAEYDLTDDHEIDDNWAFTSLGAAQDALSLPDVVNQIEVKVDDIYLAPQVLEGFRALTRAARSGW